jgi:hypothetical protein
MNELLEIVVVDNSYTVSIVFLGRMKVVEGALGKED